MDKVKRESNFELLRIISILMVISSHLVINSEINFESNYFVNTLLSRFLILGCIANHIFIIIMGYFMVKKEITYKKIIPLVLEMFFYSIMFSLLNIFIFKSKTNIISIIKGFFPIFFGNWFIRNYILLFLFTPFINKFINILKKNEFKKLVILLIIIVFCIPTFTKNAFGYSNHAIFFADYLIGAFTSFFPITFLEKKKNNIIGIFISILLLILSVFLLYILCTLLKDSSKVSHLSYFFVNNYSIFTLSLAYFLFIFFKNLKIKNSTFINKIASSTLGIYLIHENIFIKPIIWKKIFPADIYYDKAYFLILALCKIFFVFITCLIIDKLRIILFGKLEKRITEFIYNFFINIKNKFLKNCLMFNYT